MNTKLTQTESAPIVPALIFGAPKPQHISDLRALWKEAFGDTDAFLDIFFQTAFAPERCRFVLLEDKVVAALYWFDCLYEKKPVAYIYAVATAKAYRGQRLCRRLLENTHQYLSKQGYEGALLVPGSEALFRFYERNGYKTCCHYQTINCISEAQNITFREITSTEFAPLRRQFLPDGSVIQEKENLDFLQTQAHFYVGADFLLTAYGGGDTLYGIELLGNCDIASGVVHNLGYKKGIFRTPGSEIPFAMYTSFGSFTPPSYFGFAFE